MQTASLLNNGYALGRGSSFHRGTAYANGTAYASGKAYKKGKTPLEKFQDWFGKLFDWIEIKLERQANKIDKYVKRAERNADKGNYGTATKNYQNAIKATRTQISNQTKAASNYQSEANTVLNRAVKKGLISKKQAKNIKNGVANGSLRISSYGKKMQEVIKDYQEFYNKAQDAKNSIEDLQYSIEEYQNALIQLPYDKLDVAMNKLDAIGSYYETILNYHQALGKQANLDDYNRQISLAEKKLTSLNERLNQAETDLAKAESSSDKSYGGKSVNEWKTEVYNTRTEILETKISIEELKDALRDDVLWRSFEKAHTAASRLSDTLDGLQGLIDDNMLFDSNGNFTEYGITKVGLLAKQFETARKEVSNYTNDIKNLNSLYEQGYYTQDEYTEKLTELQQNLLGSASTMKGYLSEIKDMYKDMNQEELDSLNKLIDSRNKALSAKKSYYEYDKKIRDKNKDVQELQAQIAALEGVEGQSARAQRAKLQESLTKAQEELDETRQDHYFDLSSNALSEMQTILKDEFDKKWDNLGTSLEDMQQLLADATSVYSSNSSQISTALNKLLAFYGVSGIQTKFASGTRHVNGNLVGLSNEAGSEIIVTSNGIISHFNPGDGVVPSTLTKKLYQMASGQGSFGSGESFGIANINQHYDSLININGNVDRDIVKELKQFSQEILEESYNYTTKRIKQDLVRTGGSRKI